jgi:hypothetical protein
MTHSNHPAFVVSAVALAVITLSIGRLPPVCLRRTDRSPLQA